MPGVFANKEKLSSRYVPPRLPHRDSQLRILNVLVEDIASGEASTPRVALLVGPTGMGKTSSVLLLHRTLERRGVEHIFAYVNVRIEGGSPFTFFSSLYEKVTGMKASRSLSAQELFKEAVAFCGSIRKLVLIVVDEVEFHTKTTLRGIIYSLTRIHEVSSSPISAAILFVSRSLSWLKTLDPAERSSLGNFIVRYPPYSRRQLFDILSYRAEESFREGAISDAVLYWLADYTFTYMNSDVRRALDVLLYAGILAEQEKADRVVLEHVLAALRNVEAFIASADVEKLDPYEKLLLYAALKAVKRSSKPYVTFTRLWEEFTSLLEQEGFQPVDLSEFEDMVQRLSDMGALLSEGPARIAPSPTLNLELMRETVKAIRLSPR